MPASAVVNLLANRRLVNLTGFVVCVLMLVVALYVEKVMHIEPCPLCMFQRVGVAALGLVFLVAAIHHPLSRDGARIYAALIFLVALFPGYVSARHVYIQSLPPGSVPSCGATLDFMLEVFPLMEVVRKVLTGGGECAKIDWQFLGLSMPVWVLVAVIGLAAVGIYANARQQHRH
jgi:disulfide bond formation protein DsbB